MRILLDTNVVLDILLERSIFLDDSLEMMKKAISNGDKLFLSASAATDIYYIVHKNTNSKDRALTCVKSIVTILDFAKVDEEIILSATQSKLSDFEDAVVEAVAKSISADCIITRDVNHFKKSSKRILTPKQYILDSSHI